MTQKKPGGLSGEHPAVTEAAQAFRAKADSIVENTIPAFDRLNEHIAKSNPPTTVTHAYLSTACLHEAHGECRKICKFCPAQCACSCHRPAGTP